MVAILEKFRPKKKRRLDVGCFFPNACVHGKSVFVFSIVECVGATVDVMSPFFVFPFDGFLHISRINRVERANIST